MSEQKTQLPILDDYKFGFTTDLEAIAIPPGLNENTIHLISEIKKEPAYMRELRLKALKVWQDKLAKQGEPRWARVNYGPIDYQNIVYYSAPKASGQLQENPPEVLQMLEKLGIPLSEYEMLQGRGQRQSVDVVVDSASIAPPPFQEELARLGIIFCSISEAIQKYPELIKKYLGSVVPPADNFFAALNSAVFSDGSFCYVPEGVTCPMPVSTYFRINSPDAGQFERTLIIADKGAKVSYTEGCTAPSRSNHQLHAAIVELIAHEGAEIHYYTIQNWFPGDKEGRGGIYNFVTKRGLCEGAESTITWTQVETGAAITWKYPSVWLKGAKSVGEFYSVATTRGYQQADTGTKMIHIGRETKSRILSKGLSMDHGQNTFRGQVHFGPESKRSRSASTCDSLLFVSADGHCYCSANTVPNFSIENQESEYRHEAFTGRVDLEALFYLRSRGLTEREATSMIATGFCEEIVSRLPTEFNLEARKLLEIQLSGSVG